MEDEDAVEWDVVPPEPAGYPDGVKPAEVRREYALRIALERHPKTIQDALMWATTISQWLRTGRVPGVQITEIKK